MFLITLSLVLLVTWLWGVVTGYDLGGMVHILPPIAIVLFVISTYHRSRWPRTHRSSTPPADTLSRRRS